MTELEKLLAARDAADAARDAAAADFDAAWKGSGSPWPAALAVAKANRDAEDARKAFREELGKQKENSDD